MTRFTLPSKLRTTTDGPRLNPTYRRNGKLQSCEPCRKGKLRCDHIMPICGRCTRLKKSDQCVYHPAPLTRSRVSSRVSEPAPSPLPTAATPEEASSPQPLAVASHGTSVPIEESTTEADSRHLAALEFRHLTGFLGSTSYSAVLTENEGSLGIDEDEPMSQVPSNPHISADQVRKGADILTLLKDMPIFDRYIRRWYTVCQGIITIEPIMKQWASSLWVTYGGVLQGQEAEQLRKLSRLIWANTEKKLQTENVTGVSEWIESCTGKNLRWEVVGITFGVVALVATTIPEWDPILSFNGRYKDRRALITTLFHAADSCLKFSEGLGMVTDIGMWLMYEVEAIFVFLSGDASYDTWQRSGRICNALVALGWHQQNRTTDKAPFFLKEIRKRLFASAYAHDNWLAAYLGRPPRLSYRYCDVQLPLDLTDKQLLSQGPELEAALASLDSEGWAKETRIHRRTWARVWIQYCQIREDILELSIGVSTDNIGERAQQIQRKAEQTWESLPEYLREYSESIWDPKRPPIDCLYLVFIHLDYLYNEFLLQRALIKRAGADTRELIKLAKKILADIITVVAKREVLREFQDTITMLTSPGLPAACVLAVELLRQEQSPHQISTDRLDRSQIIQDLSIFASALSWVPPEDPNAAICAPGRKFLKRILDKVLSPSPPDTLLSPSSSMPAVDLSVPFFGNDSEFMPWLESIDLDNRSWTMFN